MPPKVPRRRGPRRALVVAAGLLVATLHGPSLAQTPTPTPDPSATPEPPAVSLDLLAQPVWHGPEDLLGLKLRVNNGGVAPLQGFQVVVGICERATTRSGLRSAFEQSSCIVTSSLPFTFEEVVEPSTTRVVNIDEPVASFSTLASGLDGVYPMTVALMDAAGTQIHSSLMSAVVYYTETPETPLNLALLIPINVSPQRLPDGTFLAEDGTGISAAVAEDGWLTGLLAAVSEATAPLPEPEPRPRRGKRDGRRPPPPAPPPPLHVSIAPTPRMLEEMADMADGFTADSTEVPPNGTAATDVAGWLNGLRSLLGRSNVQTVLTPYAFSDLPTQLEHLPFEMTAEQLAAGRRVLESVLEMPAEQSWLFPPAGRLDVASLQQMQVLGAGDVFVSPDSTAPVADPGLGGCPEPAYSAACAVELRTGQGGTSDALVADRTISQILARLSLRTSDRLTLQEFFAETALIREELPGISGRVIQATLPSLWHPSARLAKTFVTGIRSAPWLRSVTASEAVDVSAQKASRDIVETADRVAHAPDTFFFSQAEAASELVNSYAGIVPTGNQRIVRMKRNILVALSRTLWRKPEAANDYLASAEEEARDEMGKLEIQGPPGVTFTSREGSLQFRVINEADYPVKLDLRVTSANLTINEEELPDTFAPGAEVITVEATARTSGSFPISVVLTTPDGLLVDETLITIRSTSFNRVALTITIGALVFLVLFYVLRGLRRTPDKTGTTEL
jgi:hypothetical protein